MKSHSFLYTGDISCLFRGKSLNEKVYGGYNHMMLGMESVFESQLMESGRFKGNVQLNIQVYVPFPDGMGAERQKEKNDHYYRNGPSCSIMLKSIEMVCNNLLFADDAVIVAMSMERRWSNNPRLEMIISEVGTHGKKESSK